MFHCPTRAQTVTKSPVGGHRGHSWHKWHLNPATNASSQCWDCLCWTLPHTLGRKKSQCCFHLHPASKIPCRWLLLTKLRATFSLHFTGITCSALNSCFNICFPPHQQGDIPPRQRAGKCWAGSLITPGILKNRAE